jgi:DNA-binding NarL/FixJ family response regulator
MYAASSYRSSPSDGRIPLVATRPPVRVLFVEDNGDYALLVRVALLRSRRARFAVDHETRLQDGLRRLAYGRYDIILLDLSLPDAEAPDTMSCMLGVANKPPVLVLTATDDDTLAASAVEAGADGYLVKDEIDRHRLAEAILLALERREYVSSLDVWDIESPDGETEVIGDLGDVGGVRRRRRWSVPRRTRRASRS